MAKKRGLAGAEEVEVYGDYIPVDDSDQPTVNTVVSGTDSEAPYVGVTTVTPTITTPTSTTSPTAATEEEVVPEEPIEEPWTLPKHEPVPIPEFDPNAIPTPDVGEVQVGVLEAAPAPAYERSEEEEAWAEMYSGEIASIIKEGGKGIDEATQQLMRQQQFDILKTREKENIRLLQQDMERRGITNAGLYFSEEQNIKATTTRALADSMTNIQIKSALMKAASFEHALGQAGLFLGYLTEQSQLAYAPKLETWRAQERAKEVTYLTQAEARFTTYRAQAEAKLCGLQANVDIYKVKLNQAYAENNMYIQQQLTSELNEQIHQGNVEIAKLEIEYAREQANADRSANMLGTILGAVSGIFA